MVELYWKVTVGYNPKVEATLETLRAKFEADFETATKMLGSMFTPEVRKMPSWPRSWANFSLLQLYSHRNAWANLHLLGQPNTFLA